MRGSKIAARVLAVLSVASAAHAQTAPPAADQEIIVTAQRRAQPVQTVPISITVLDGRALEASGIYRADDLLLRVPSLTLLSNNSPQGQLNLIRGVGTFSYSDAVEPSVGTLIDGVVLGRQGMGLIDYFDVDRVEVLKGPQGTLFGKNASAGVINIVTRNPSFTPGAEAEASHGNYNEFRLAGAVTGALVPDLLAVRLAGFYHRRDGFIAQPVRGSTLDNIDRFGVRTKLLLAPADSAGHDLVTLDYSNIDERCCHPTVRTYGSSVQQFLIAPIIGAPAVANLISASESPVFNKTKLFALTNQFDYEFASGLKLTAITGYRSWRNRNATENDGTPLPILGAPGDGEQARYDQYTQEIRLASPERNRFYYTLGLYYFLLNSHSAHKDSGSLGLQLPPGFLFSQTTSSRSEVENYAAFADLAYKLTPKLLLIAGGRALFDRVTASFDRASSFPLPGTTLGDTGAGQGRRGDTNYSARGVVQYQWTDDIMSYASLSRGYKGYGADTYSPPPAIAPGTYGDTFARPETSLNYEIGAKTRLFDRKLTLNVTAFWTDFTDLQANLFNPATAQFVLVTARKYRTRGVEAEILARPAHGLMLSASGTYDDTALVSFPGVPCVPGPGIIPCIDGTRNFTGGRAPLVPEYAFALAAEYTHDIARGVAGFARLDYSWKDRILFALDQDPNKFEHPVGLIDARLGASFANGHIQASLYGRNLTDKRWTNLLFDTVIWGGYSQYPEIGRTYGVELATKF